MKTCCAAGPCSRPRLGRAAPAAAGGACGLTNREIAAGLLLPVSTLQQRLTRIYRKLRIQGRAELPAALVQGARADAAVG